MKKCPYCAEEIQDEAVKCKHCDEMTSQTQVPPPSQAGNTLPPAQAMKKPSVAMGCFGIIALYFVVFWIGDLAGCNWTQGPSDGVSATSTHPKTPGMRYVGPGGAVFGSDSHGRTVRLEPGTAVRDAGGSYVDPMDGPVRIYTVTEGPLQGGQVPLKESDLEPQ